MKQTVIKSLLVKQLLLGLILTIINVQCTDKVTPPLYSEEDSGEIPVILSMEPAQGLAGVTEIKIIGENFSDEIENNIVNFSSIPAKIIFASNNELHVLAPDLVSDSIQVKISVSNKEKFSKPHNYKLDAAVSKVYPFKTYQKPYGITSDELGNLYFSLVEDNVGKGIKKINTKGEMVDFAPKGGETFFTDLKYKSGGMLYGVRGVRAIFEITEGSASKTFAVLDNGTSMFTFDFDKNKNIWTAGTGGKIFRVTPSKEIKSFNFADDVTAIKIFNDYLYLATHNANAQNIVRMHIISSDSLGTTENYFSFSDKFGNGVLDIQTITFSNDGQLFIGTDGSNPIIYVNTDGSYGYWYESLIDPQIINLGWGTGTELYALKKAYSASGIDTTQTIYSINMEKIGAPELGRD
jgi:hypothetical protein